MIVRLTTRGHADDLRRLRRSLAIIMRGDGWQRARSGAWLRLAPCPIIDITAAQVANHVRVYLYASSRAQAHPRINVTVYLPGRFALGAPDAIERRELPARSPLAVLAEQAL